MQDASARATDPHIEEATAKSERTNDRRGKKREAAARDERIERGRTEDAVELRDAVLYLGAIVEHVAVDVMHAVEGGERDAAARAHKVELGRARLAIVEGNHDDTRYVRERRLDQQLVRRGEELCLHAVGRRAKGEERFREQEDEFLSAVQR